MVNIGVLALQGAVSEHIHAIEQVGAKGIAVKKVEQLKEIDGIILPGGESTTIGRLMRLYGFIDALREFHQAGKPIFGTCAGMILLAKDIEGQDETHLRLMDIQVRRNAFGRQVDSFETELRIPGIADNFLAVFIRAPYITRVLSDEVEVLAKYDEKIVAAKQGNLLATAFHPELTDDFRIHAYFVEMAKQAK